VAETTASPTYSTLDEIQNVSVAIAVVVVLVIVLVSSRQMVRDLVNEHLSKVRKREVHMLEVTTAISQELQLQPLLEKVIATITEILDADRSTLFLYDATRDELWSNVAEGLETREIRFPAGAGIAGTAFKTGEIINIADAYKDARFNKAIDKKTGYRTQSILCMRIEGKGNTPVGVVQVLNKKGGPFLELDQKRLRAFTSQAAIAIENARLFEEVFTIKNYNEAIFDSMKNAVITFDAQGRIATANAAAKKLMKLPPDEQIEQQEVEQYFGGNNIWIAQTIRRVLDSGENDETLDSMLWVRGESGALEGASVNLTVLPLTTSLGERMGCLLVLEDITLEKRLRSTMARYMTKEVADKLIDDKNASASLGGSLQVATVLFSDIRSFTTFSERNGPTETVAMLNEYFTMMVDLIMDNGGILDKFIGDAIMAVYGAPFSTHEDADNSLKTAIQMQFALNVFNMKRKMAGKDPIEIGIGLNTDEVIAGNIGSRKRMDYTVIGDGVNLAARLEGATKAYGTRLLVSEFTVEALTQEYQLREVDRITVKGKTKPVAIFEVLDVFNKTAFPEKEAVLEAYGQGLTCYRSQSFQEAIVHFDKALEFHPGDRVSAMYKERCNAFIEDPPPEDWDGVWVMKTK